VNFYFQELLKLFKISPDEKSPKKKVWDSFPREVQEIMAPLLSSYYKNSVGPNVQMPHPIIGFVNYSCFLMVVYNFNFPVLLTWVQKLMSCLEDAF